MSLLARRHNPNDHPCFLRESNTILDFRERLTQPRAEYNPIERRWCVLEVYWSGELLDSEEAVLGFAANMTHAGRHPHLDCVSATYSSGVRRSGAERKMLEGRLVRLPTLPRWSVTIAPPEPVEIILAA
jgi:hypothetical protein